MNTQLLKRILSFALCLTMLLGNIPATVFAAEETEVIAQSILPTGAPTESPVQETQSPTLSAVPEETAAPTAAATEPPARETQAPTLPAVPEETAAPTAAPTEPLAEETIAPTESMVPEETTAPAEDVEAEEGIVTDASAMAGADAVASGACGENLTWSLDADGTLTVSGTGAMAFTHAGSPISTPSWHSYMDQIKTVIIEDGVTSLTGGCFNDCANLTKVVLPASVMTFEIIDEFWNYGTMYDDIRSAFSECPGITSAGPVGSGCDLEFGWTDEIPQYAFVRLPNLKKLIMPGTITKLYRRSFYLCPGLTTAGPGSSYDYEINWTKKIPERAFSGLEGLKEAKLPETVTGIGVYAFADCSALEKVNIPEGVTAIDGGVFSQCTALTGIELPAGLRSIGEYAFFLSGLQSIILPDNLEAIGENAFDHCGFEEITFPASLKTIGASAFSSCDNLRVVKLPDTVTAIGEFAFSSCSGLIHVEWPASIPTISSRCFSNCENLKTIRIPKTVTEVADYAFYNCNAMVNIYYAGSYGSWRKITIGKENEILEMIPLFCEEQDKGSCGETTTWTLSQEGVLTISGQGAVTETPWRELAGLITIKEIVVQEGVTQLPVSAFFWNTVEKVTMAGSVATLGGSLFSNQSPIGSAGPIGSGCDYEYGWTTAIPKSAFQNLQNLTSFQWPEATADGGMKEIGNQAFWGCKALTEITIPDTVEKIGVQAFAYCESLTKLTIPPKVSQLIYVAEKCKSLTDYVILGPVRNFQAGELTGCVSLKSITLPRSFNYVMENTFRDCTALTDVHFMGTDAEWRGVYIAENGNEPLLNATIHTGWGMVYLGDVRYYDSWIAEQNLVDFTGDAYECLVTEETDISFRDNPEALVDSYVLVKTRWEDGKEILLSMKPVETRTGVVSSCDGYWTVVNGTAYTTPVDLENPYSYTGKYVLLHVFDGNIVGIQPLEFEHYLDNHALRIHRSGIAYAYFTVPAYQVVTYEVGDTAGTAQADEKGILKIPLGYYDTIGAHSVNIRITKAGNVDLNPALERSATVTVTPMSFTQEWLGSFDASVAVGIGPSVGFKISSIDAYATLAQIGAEGGGGSTLRIKREYDNGKETLEITKDKQCEFGVSVESGIGANVGKAELTVIGGSGKLKSSGAVTYGIKFDDYSHANEDQRKTIGIFFLGELLEANPNCILYDSLYESLAETCYDAAGATVVDGCSVGIAGETSLDLGAVKVNDVTLFTGVSREGEMGMSFARKDYSDGTMQKTSSYKSENKLSLCSVTVGSPNLAVSMGGALQMDMLGTDIEIESTSSDTTQKIDATFLSAQEAGLGSFLLNHLYSTEYNKYTFENAALDKLIETDSGFKSYLQGRRGAVSLSNIAQMGKLVSSSDVPIPYSSELKNEMLLTVPLVIGAALGLEFSMGVTFSNMETSKYETASGFALGDQIHLTSESQGVHSAVNSAAWNLDEMIGDYFQAIADDVKASVDTYVGNIKEGAQSVWAWISGKPESTKNRSVSITAVKSGAGAGQQRTAWARSYVVDTVDLTDERTALSDGVRTGSGNYALSSAATIGRPFLVNVSDDTTGESIKDFGDEPLTFTIRYGEEDLKAAGLSKYDPIVLDGGIAMYRYSDNGDYFEYVGGVNDLASKTVTAEITKPGQYVLAADSCAPSVRYLEITDFHSNPTVIAGIEDLSGLDPQAFVFKLDQEIRVDKNNFEDYYNTQTSVFTYKVPEDQSLTEGKHTISFTLQDTTGNCETYEYSFPVDLTAPEVSDVTVTGKTNAGSAVEVRARVTDPNLTGVYAVFSKLMPDGSWSEEVSASMSDLGDGLWGLDYEGDGSFIRVYVKAEDIAKNTTVSEKKDAHPYVEEVSLSQEYVALYTGQHLRMAAQVKPAQLSSSLEWSVDNDSVITVDENGEVTAKAAGTAYVIATITDGESIKSARCRVDVAESIQLKGIQLSTDKVTTELFKTDYATFEVLLRLPQNEPETGLMTVSRPAAMALAGEDSKKSVTIDSVAFTSTELNDLFELRMLDDRTVQLIPRYETAIEMALANSKSVKGTYKDTIRVTVQGTDYYSEMLTLTVKQTKPKLKGTVAAFNSFYSGQSQPIVITGGTPTGFDENEAKNTAKATAIPNWLTLSEDGILTLKPDAPLKSVSGKVYVMVETEEWRIPAAVTLSVKNTYKAPSLKLSASSVTMSTWTESSAGVQLKLLPKAKTDTLEKLNVLGIVAPDGYTIENFDHTDGSFTLKAYKEFVPGEIKLTVYFSDTDVTLPLALKVKTKTLTVKPSVSSLTLNVAAKDSGVITLKADPADHLIAAPELRLTGTETVNGRKTTVDKLDSGELDIRFEDGQLIIKTTKDTPEKASYKLGISSGGSKEAAVTINVMSGEPSVTYKATGSMDLSFPAQAATIKPTFKNYKGEIVDFSYGVTELQGKTVVNEDVKDAFYVEYDGTDFKIRCTDDQINTGNTYQVRLDVKLNNGETIGNTINLKVKRTAVKLKLSASKLTLNKLTGDSGSIDVTCTTKGYAFTEPVREVTDKNKQPAADQLDIGWENGKLIVKTVPETVYGMTYTVTLRGDAYGTPAKLTVSIPMEEKSTVTATLKAKGSIDVIRDGSAITLTPTYKNITDRTGLTESLVFSKTANRVTTDATDLFDYSKNGDGTFTVTKKAGAKLDHSAKYKVKLVTYKGGAKLCETKEISISVKAGSAKLTVKTDNTTLFAKDKNDRALVWFEAADASLNGVKDITIASATQAKQFEVIPYGNGVYAIGFAGGKADSVLTKKNINSVSIKLNVFVDGNETSKASTTATVKLTIVK